MNEDYYFGCWSSQQIGHYLYLPSGRSVHRTPEGFPFSQYEILDGGLLPTGPQTEGEATFAHINGWTIISFWDRSADKRGSCNSSFLIRGLYDFGSACGRARTLFPSIWERFNFPIVERHSAE